MLCKVIPIVAVLVLVIFMILFIVILNTVSDKKELFTHVILYILCSYLFGRVVQFFPPVLSITTFTEIVAFTQKLII